MAIESSALHSAGTGSPVPAESSVELERIRRRFRELPAADARTGMRSARPLLALLSSRLGMPVVPDLGPAVVPDQLAVLAFDAYRAGVGDGLSEALADLRRAL